MIGEIYTGLVKKYKGKIYICKPKKVYGNDPWEIEISEPDMTFEEMLNDPELFVPHHLLEIKYSKDELEQMNRYKVVPANELIWMRSSTHAGNNVIHKACIQKGNLPDHLKSFWKGRKRTEQDKIKRSLARKGKPNLKAKGKVFSEFGRKFKEHFGITLTDNPKLYLYHRNWYRNHNNTCKWEVEDGKA